MPEMKKRGNYSCLEALQYTQTLWPPSLEASCSDVRQAGVDESQML